MNQKFLTNMTGLQMMTYDIEETDNKLIVHIDELEDSYFALISARKFAEDIGFSKVESTLIATVVSELSTNIIRYAGGGYVILRKIYNGEIVGFELNAIDEGPGIKDVEMAMSDSFTTSKDSLGLGLSSLKRIMDEYKISSNNKGTRITAVKWKK